MKSPDRVIQRYTWYAKGSLSTLLSFYSFRTADIIILINAHQLSWRVLPMRQQAAVSRHVPLHLSLLPSIPPFPSAPTISLLTARAQMDGWSSPSKNVRRRAPPIQPSKHVRRRAPPPFVQANLHVVYEGVESQLPSAAPVCVELLKKMLSS